MDTNMTEVLIELQLDDEGTSLSGVQLLPLGAWDHPKGKIHITPEKAQGFVSSFKDKVAGQDLPLFFVHTDKSNAANPRYGQAAGWITDLKFDSDKGVVIDIDFTKEAATEVRDKKWRYLSAEYFDKVQLPHHDHPYNDVIVGAALVNRPHLKGMNPILNEETGHMFVVEAGKTEATNGGGSMDPILQALAKSAGIELPEGATELSEEQSQTIQTFLQDQSKQVTDLGAKVKLLEDAASEEDKDKNKEKNLAEAGFVEEAKILAEYRGDKFVATLAESVPEGHVLSPAAKAKAKEYGTTLDPKHLTEAIQMVIEGKGLVDLTEHGTSGEGSDGDTSGDKNDFGDKIMKLAEDITKEDDKVSLSEALDTVASQHPALWNDYQTSMGAITGAKLEVV